MDNTLRNIRVNKWTIGVITFGLLVNLGLSKAGRDRSLTWQDINIIRQWKEIVFSIVVGQSGKAIRKVKKRKTEHHAHH